MAVSTVERLLLKAVVYGNLSFRPEALDPDIVSETSPKQVKWSFDQLPEEKKAEFNRYFGRRPRMLFNRFPFRIYQKSGTKDRSWGNMGIHYEYDLPDRKTEARRLVLAGFDLKRLKGEYFTFAQLHEIRKANERGIDVTPLLNNNFSRFQMKVLSTAIHHGFDVSDMLDHKIPAREMAAMYYDRVEAQILKIQEDKGVKEQLAVVDEMDKSKQKTQERHQPSMSLDQQMKQAQAVRDQQSRVVQFPNRDKMAPERG